MLLQRELTYSPIQYKFLNEPGDAVGVKYIQQHPPPYHPIISHVNQKPILVTGIGGYIACHILEVLFSRGYSVRGTVRSTDPNRNRHVWSIYDKWRKVNSDIRLELFEADLLREGSFDDAVNGCDYVLHVASPFVLDVKDKQRDLIDPAKLGTLNVLRSCAKFHVRKVVLTSSIASITPAGVPTNCSRLTKVFDENDWNEQSSIDENPYYYSKKLAEEAAWDFMRDLERTNGTNGGGEPMKLVVINPTLVWGPSHTKTINQSVSVVSKIALGEFPFIFNFSWCSVDVRDVAEAHVRAIEIPTVSGRYICGNETVSMNYMCKTMKKHFPQLSSIPQCSLTGAVGDALIVTSSLVQPSGLGTYLRSNISHIVFVNNQKIVNEMGMTFRSMEQTIVDTTRSLIELRLVPVPPNNSKPLLTSKL